MKHYDNDGADDGVVCNDDDNDEETKMVKIITRKGCWWFTKISENISEAESDTDQVWLW